MSGISAVRASLFAPPPNTIRRPTAALGSAPADTAAVSPSASPQPGPAVAGTPAQGGELGPLAEGLVKLVRTLQHFFGKTDPQAAESFEKAVGTVLRHLDPAREQGLGTASNGEPVAPGQARMQRIEFAFHASVTEIDVRLRGGEQFSARQVEMTFQLRFTEALGETDPLVLDLRGDRGGEQSVAGEPSEVTAFRVQAFLLQFSASFTQTSASTAGRAGSFIGDAGTARSSASLLNHLA
jgi:hypothetical protein